MDATTRQIDHDDDDDDDDEEEGSRGRDASSTREEMPRHEVYWS
jgi:hypothetical protein